MVAPHARTFVPHPTGSVPTLFPGIDQPGRYRWWWSIESSQVKQHEFAEDLDAGIDGAMRGGDCTAAMHDYGHDCGSPRLRLRQPFHSERTPVRTLC